MSKAIKKIIELTFGKKCTTCKSYIGRENTECLKCWPSTEGYDMQLPKRPEDPF